MLARCIYGSFYNGFEVSSVLVHLLARPPKPPPPFAEPENDPFDKEFYWKMINLGRGCHLRKSATASSPSSPGPPELTGLTGATGLGLTGLTRLTGLTGLAGLTDRAHRTYSQYWAHRAHPRCILHCKNNAKRTGRSSRLRQMVAHSIYYIFYD